MITNAWAGFDFGLGFDVEMLRKSVGDFAQDRIAPRADEIDRQNEFPRDLWPEMGGLGLLGITVEPEYGGTGLGLAIAKILVLEHGGSIRLDRNPGAGVTACVDLPEHVEVLAMAGGAA